MKTPQLLFATKNPGKLIELRALLQGLRVEVIGAAEMEGLPDVEEDGATFLENAIKKAREVAAACRLPALADDSGLEVDALSGRPGVHSARYAGPLASDEDNNRKLLAELADVPPSERGARFRCVMALCDPCGSLGEQALTASGVCEGRILLEPRGTGGFGYDPLFFCPELGQTFAEAGVGPKGGVSHRAQATLALMPALCEYLHLQTCA